MAKLIAWFNDPKASGRKRGLGFALVALGAVFSALAPLLLQACAPPAPLLSGWVCRVSEADLGSLLTTLGTYLQAVDPALTTGGFLVGLWGLIDAWRKKRRSPAAALLILAMVLMPGPARAQDMPVNAMSTEQTEAAPPAPLSASIAAEQTEGVTVDVQTWTLSVLTRDERREYAGGRVTVDAPAGPVRLFARADISGTQDAHDFSFEDYKTFRSIEAFVGVRYPFKSGVALAVAGGATYSIEGSDGPADPRLYSLLALARFPLPGNGYAYAGGGYRGPVGGLAAVASVSYPMGPTRAIVDYDFPLQVDAAGLPKPWVLRTGIAVPLKKWTLK